jgi:hypothetical protein
MRQGRGTGGEERLNISTGQKCRRARASKNGAQQRCRSHSCKSSTMKRPRESTAWQTGLRKDTKAQEKAIEISR